MKKRKTVKQPKSKQDLQRCKSGLTKQLREGVEYWVEVVESVYGDVVPGMQGQIVSILKQGYGIKIKGNFMDAFHKRHLSERILFFEAREIKKCPKPSPLTQVSTP